MPLLSPVCFKIKRCFCQKNMLIDDKPVSNSQPLLRALFYDSSSVMIEFVMTILI